MAGFSISIKHGLQIRASGGVSIDYLVGKTDVELSENIIKKIITIQKLPTEDKNHIMYSLDGLIQHAITRQAYTK